MSPINLNEGLQVDLHVAKKVIGYLAKTWFPMSVGRWALPLVCSSRPPSVVRGQPNVRCELHLLVCLEKIAHFAERALLELVGET
jgi:hypothetical protein